MAEQALREAPLQAGQPLDALEWSRIRERAIFEFCKWDVQCEDHSVLAQFPLLLNPESARLLNAKAEALAREALTAEQEILLRPDLLERLALPRRILRSLECHPAPAGQAREFRVMRFDFHFTPDGWRISEVNADVPGGFIEATAWNALFAETWSAETAPADPSKTYARGIRAATEEDSLVALVHATAYSDDRQVMMHLARRFEEHGLRAYLCSPSHLHWEQGRARFRADFAPGTIDAIVRFFPAEWLPNLAEENMWKPYFERTDTLLSNPGTAIVLQSKRFPLVWQELRTDLTTWHELLPKTYDFAEAKSGRAADGGHVLKPALGRVGEDVGIRGVTPDGEWQQVLERARKRPAQWVLQERFEILPMPSAEGLRYPCIGVFTIGGTAAGFYGRVSHGPIINRDAQDVAVLIADEFSARQT